jgi:hypothetical protein
MLGNKNPGPGTYKVAEMIVEGPRFSMREKHKPAKARDVPGPGAYNPKVEESQK